ncbi:MAG: flagellar biosynthesis protein FlhB [Acidimicrobiia bacterium]
MAKDDRTEAPTPRRKREARRDGKIARSADLVAWTQLLATALLAPVVFRVGADAVVGFFHEATRRAAEPDEGAALAVLGAGARAGVVALAPLAVGLMVLGVVGNVAQVGFAVSGKAVKPKAERLNPLAGLKRLASPQHGWETLKLLLKLGVLTAVAWRTTAPLPARLLDGGGPGALGSLQLVGTAAVRLVRDTAVAGLVLAVLDYGYQRRRIGRELRMTKQEVREEHRQSEGDPSLRARLRSRQIEISRARMLADVAGATAVVVNPTHVAVAVRYEPGDGAPRVVAKGKGRVAARIRALAEENGTPIVRDVALARALHGACEVGQAIPPELYDAVARLIAFVMTVGRRSRLGGVLHMVGPTPA